MIDLYIIKKKKIVKTLKYYTGQIWNPMRRFKQKIKKIVLSKKEGPLASFNEWILDNFRSNDSDSFGFIYNYNNKRINKLVIES